MGPAGPCGQPLYCHQGIVGPVLARCPGCGSEVEDPVSGEELVCPECGARSPSPGHDPTGGPTTDARRIEADKPRRPGRVPDPYSDDLIEGLLVIWDLFKRMLHAIVYVGIFSLMAVVLIDLVILVWGYLPVHDAALEGKATSVLFLMGLYPVGEVEWTGWGALAIGALLLAVAAALLWANRSVRFPGLGGLGTRLVAVLMAAGGVCVVAWGVYLATTGHLTEGMAAPNWIPTPIGIVRLKFHLLAHWHGMLVGAILISFGIMAVKDWRELVGRFRRSVPRLQLPTIRTDNTWVVVFRFYLAILGLYVVYYLLLALSNVDPTTPAFHKDPIWEQLHTFAHASVWEELVSRVLMLGLPLWIYHVMSGSRVREPWRYAVGGGFRIENAAFVLIFVQAFIFALAHVAGWDFWKVIPTTISGMAFGYLFLKRGVWAAIALHFTFDYLGMTPRIVASWGVDIDLAFGLLELLWIGVGLVLLVHSVVLLVREGPGAVRRALLGPTRDGPAQG